MHNLRKLSNTTAYFFRLLVVSVFCVFITRKLGGLIVLGNPGASWWIPEDFFNKQSIVYSGGVGEDISFDAELIKKHHCQIFAFDPTPRAIEYVHSHPLANFHFYPVGIWKKNKLLRFFEPADSQYVSHSVVNLQKTANFFVAPCLTIASIMDKLKHKKIDLLKLDIEGAEFHALDQMLHDAIYPRVLAIEFDQPKTIESMISYIQKLRSRGYSLIKQSHFNFTFVRKTTD